MLSRISRFCRLFIMAPETSFVDTATAEVNDACRNEASADVGVAYDDLQWYAMRDLKRANAKMPAYKLLRQSGFEVFTPMRWHLVTKHGRREREEVPCIPDLLFVHASADELDPVVEATPTLQYRYERGRGYRTPMTVRRVDMQRFILAVRATEEPRYYSPDEITPDMYGRRVLIVGGPLDGLEGRLLKARGTRRRHLLIDLAQLLTVAVEVAPEFIRLLPE